MSITSSLNIIVISLIAFGGRFFKILPLIRSIPGAYDVSRMERLVTRMLELVRLKKLINTVGKLDRRI